MAVTPPPTGSSPAASVASGTVLTGRYRLDSQLASGGMAQVWRGTDEVLRRSVAVKILHPHLAADETFVARFRQEAIAVAKLSHPAIVSVYDTCNDDGVQAIVMELVRGDTLRHRLDAGALEPTMAASVAAQVAGALDVAHAAGLVHRDIKPANILISEDGRVKVGDFGIAKAAESADLTQEGSFIGTAKYLAPEQVEGAAVDGRTDLYSLGIVLYEMLCGQVPFEGDTSSATALARLHQDPRRPRLIRASIPAELEAVTMTLLEREPDRRYPTATHARAALLEATGGQIPAIIDVTAVEPRPTATPPPHPPGFPPPSFPGAPGPGPQSPQPVESHVRFRESERNWLLPTFLLVLAAISLVIAAVLIGRSGSALFGEDGDSTSTTLGKPEPLAVAGSADFDPSGDSEENRPLVPRAIDGDPASFWETEYYGVRGDNDISWKTGVGYYVELTDDATIRSLNVDTPSRGWRLDVFVAGAPADTLAGWGDVRVHIESGKAGTNAIELPPSVEGKAVLLWFTKVGADPLPDGPYKGRYVMRINEVQVLG